MSGSFEANNKGSEFDNKPINHDIWNVLMCKTTGKKMSNFTPMKSDMIEHCANMEANCGSVYRFGTHASIWQAIIKNCKSIQGVKTGLYYNLWILSLCPETGLSNDDLFGT